MTAHIHAENMKLYAQDAAETDDPAARWEFQSAYTDGKWTSLPADHPQWDERAFYRRKPRTHMVNGFEVPEPMREAPIDGTLVWLSAPHIDDYCASLTWSEGRDWNRRYLARGLVHATKEAAVANAKAMIGVQP